MKRCTTRHPDITLGRRKLHCEEEEGHLGPHFNSFANQSWGTPEQMEHRRRRNEMLENESTVSRLLFHRWRLGDGLANRRIEPDKDEFL